MIKKIKFSIKKFVGNLMDCRLCTINTDTRKIKKTKISITAINGDKRRDQEHRYTKNKENQNLLEQNSAHKSDCD